jgi:flavin reductase (DIM6/NTAB) family NADH-FMN oxidoreductase RutF
MNEQNVVLESSARALGRLASGLMLVSCGTKETPQGFVASWIQQAAFSPLRITMAIGRERTALGILSRPEAPFSVSILDKDSSHLMKSFFKPDPFAAVRWEFQDPFIFLPEALAVIYCRTVKTMEAGDHEIILADVVNGNILRDGTPLTHTRGTALNY